MTNHPKASRGVPRGVAILAATTDDSYRLEACTTKSRRALTLVEMLVGMAITLVMMAAVVNLFANISEGIRNRRATMEVSASLRIARARLYNDLAGATCLKYPKDAFGVMPKPDVNNPPDGYFEYVEGEQADENPGGGFDPATSLVPSTNRPFNSKGEPIDPAILTDGGGRGDFDDILAMTVESTTERFRGKGRGLRPGGDPRVDVPTSPDDLGPTGAWVDMAISSKLAEVVWFSVQNANRSEGEPGMRKIYRRVLLIAPWYGTETKVIGGVPVTGSDPRLDLTDTTLYPDFAARIQALRDFQNEYDISARLENQRIVPNTLADLARREHRFAHMTDPMDYPSPTSPGYYPYFFPYDVDTPSAPESADEVDSSLRRFRGEREGEDLVLTDVLAFDVQVYDPGAPLYEYEGSIIPPSSSRAFTDTTAPTDAVRNGTLTGFGAYVDLGWNNAGNYVAAATSPPTLFQQGRQLGWHPRAPNSFRGDPAVYDSWTTYYETDGVDQDNRENESPINVLTGADEGTNGLDDPDPSLAGDPRYLDAPGDIAINGPDDPLERETSPPYPYPLKGVQVKLRVYEPESRQIRESTVTRNLEK